MDYTSAEEMINLAIGIDNNLNYRLKRGFIREKQNNYKGALEDYQYVISYQYSESLEKRIEICLFEMQK
jgi:hypothetical protein